MDGINALIATGGGYRPPAFDLQTAQGNALQNQLMQQQVQAQPYKRQLDEQALRLRELALDVKARAMEAGPAEKPISLDYDWGTITGLPETLAEVADAVARFPDQAKGPEFNAYLAQKGVSLKAKEQKAAEPPKTRTRQEGSQEITEEWTGTGWKKIGGGPKWNPEKAGMKVYDAQGNLIVDTGGGPVTTKTKGAVEEKLLGGREQLARIEAIAAEYKPEYQQIGSRWANTWTGIKASLGKEVPPEDAKKLTEWKKFQRKSIENINLYIKELTGAQMSEREADRLRLAQPDPGEKWYQGDDPITFKAKMDDVVRATRASIARYEYYRAKGLSDAEIKGVIKTDSGISLDKLISAME